MPRCFRTIEAGLGRAGLKVITNGTRTLLVQLSTFHIHLFQICKLLC